MSDCLVCGARTDAYLCNGCGDELARALGDMPWLLEELARAAARQTRVYRAARRAATPDQDWRGSPNALPVTPLPVDLDAVARIDEIRSTLTTWARHIAETRGIEACVPWRCLVPWLTEHVDTIRYDQAAAVMHAEITALRDRARRAIDRSPSLLYAGPCHFAGAVVTREVNGTIYVERGRCEADLYRSGDKAEIKCGQCGATYTVAEREKWLRDSIASSLVSMDEVLAVVGPKRLFPTYPRPPRSTVQAWVRQGRLIAHGQNHVGEPTFVGAELLDLVAAYVPRPTTRRKSNVA